eukprot:m.245920 g.245920  ORF g.245920 m.245920 type:complete len:252 (-) comp19055_c2_seq4:36-791(-)
MLPAWRLFCTEHVEAAGDQDAEGTRTRAVGLDHSLHDQLCTALPPLLDQPVVIKGPPDSGKTSLLFQLALSLAHQGDAVLFLAASKSKLRRRLPLLSACEGAPSRDTLSRIVVQYVSSPKELRLYLATIHLNQHAIALQPNHLIVDDLECFIEDKELTDTARTCSLLASAFQWLREPHNDKECWFVGAMRGLPKEKESARLDTLLGRWFPQILYAKILGEGNASLDLPSNHRVEFAMSAEGRALSRIVQPV